MNWMISRIMLVIVTALTVGCSDAANPVTGGTAGVLSSGGKPLSQMQVNVFAVDSAAAAAGNYVPVGRGYLSNQGTFELVTDNSAGPLVLSAGSYRFTVESLGAEVTIPTEFTDPATTPLQIQHEPGQPVVLAMPKMQGMP